MAEPACTCGDDIEPLFPGEADYRGRHKSNCALIKHRDAEAELVAISNAFRSPQGLFIPDPIGLYNWESYYDTMETYYNDNTEPEALKDRAKATFLPMLYKAVLDPVPPPLYLDSELVPNPSGKPLIYKRPTMFRFWLRYIQRKFYDLQRVS